MDTGQKKRDKVWKQWEKGKEKGKEKDGKEKEDTGSKEET